MGDMRRSRCGVGCARSDAEGRAGLAMRARVLHVGPRGGNGGRGWLGRARPNAASRVTRGAALLRRDCRARGRRWSRAQGRAWRRDAGALRSDGRYLDSRV
mgnify:CR=1 FL=1